MARRSRSHENRPTILVDSSVWIDYFNGTVTPQSEKLDQLLGREPLAIGDLILTEVLRGFADEREFTSAKTILASLEIVNLGGEEMALKAADNHRTLRRRGITVRKTIDTIIATRCIADGYRLLHGGRDFDAFSKHLGLVAVEF